MTMVTMAIIMTVDEKLQMLDMLRLTLASAKLMIPMVESAMAKNAEELKSLKLSVTDLEAKIIGLESQPSIQ
jgi:hypothetical protein